MPGFLIEMVVLLTFSKAGLEPQNPSPLNLLSWWDYRHKPLHLAKKVFLIHGWLNP
jgi:hypothetical protein